MKTMKVKRDTDVAGLSQALSNCLRTEGGVIVRAVGMEASYVMLKAVAALEGYTDQPVFSVSSFFASIGSGETRLTGIQLILQRSA